MKSKFLCMYQMKFVTKNGPFFTTGTEYSSTI